MVNLIESTSRPLYIFDFDDTLAETHSRVWVVNPTTGRHAITPAQYAVYEPDPADTFDFSEFEELIKPEELPKYVQRLKSAIKSGQDVSIVTARSSTKPVAQFLQQIGVNKGVKIATVGSSDPQKKLDYIEQKIKSGNFSDVVMYDDSPKNIDAFKTLGRRYPNIYFHGHQVPKPNKPEAPSTLQQSLDGVIQNPETGNDILIRTALGYEKNHPARRAAVQFLQQKHKGR